jgi:hypothetical protein
MVWEYLSINIMAPRPHANRAVALEIFVNGVPSTFRSEFVNNEWTKLENPHIHQILTDLVKLLDDAVDKQYQRFRVNSDPAVIANFFAKDGWKLCKVRDNKQYLLFEREI